MNTVNSLININACYITNDNSHYNKFMCIYITSAETQRFLCHTKCGFYSYADAINWYLTMFPNGNILSQENFLQLQTQMINALTPKQPNVIDPLHMTEIPRTTLSKRTSDGQLISEFE